MEVLTNDIIMSFDYMSRYNGCHRYFNTQTNAWVTSIPGHIDKTLPFREHAVHPGDTLDSLAKAYYGNPTYYWIIADFNSILDPFDDAVQYNLYKKYSTLKFPNFNSIRRVS